MEMKITITIDGKDITLPLDKAKELHGELDKIFGSKKQPYSAPFHPNGVRDIDYVPPLIVTCVDNTTGSYYNLSKSYQLSSSRNIPKGLYPCKTPKIA